jgi:hypothetical protein
MALLENIWLSSKIFLVFLHLKFPCGLAGPTVFMTAGHILIGPLRGNFREIFQSLFQVPGADPAFII